MSLFELRATITGRREVAAGMVVLAMRAPDIAAMARAGQFVNLGAGDGVFLRRPFSVYNVTGDSLEIVLRAVGTGTRALAEMQVGDTLSCLGPLGHGFDFPEAGSVLLLSGGLGVAPMPLAARDARRAGLRVTWVHGARNAAELCTEWSGDEVIWATDDGSRGHHGTVIEAAPALDDATVMACGPNRMLEAVGARWPDAQVAVETYMGCGTGVCLGCAVPLAGGGYDRACKEGPVYRATAVDWAKLPSQLHYAMHP